MRPATLITPALIALTMIAPAAHATTGPAEHPCQTDTRLLHEKKELAAVYANAVTQEHDTSNPPEVRQSFAGEAHRIEEDFNWIDIQLERATPKCETTP